VAETRFPEWFDKAKLAQQAPGNLPLLRDALVQALDLVTGPLPQWGEDTHQNRRALLANHLTNLEGVAARLGATRLCLLAEALGRHYLDAKHGRPSRDTVPLETMVAELLAECERTHRALVALGTAGAE
jgi:hypothetical protein